MIMASGSSGTRNCVGCGRAIAWDANVCPYCGHDYRVQMAPQYAQPQISEGMKILFYILSFLIFIVGIIIGVIYYTKPDPESKHVGKMCIILAVAGILVGVICWVAVVGAMWFGSL
jgi:cytochrome b subunit of formate dehydrogenase